VTVHIRESLEPKTLTVGPGTAVRWVNESQNRYRMRSRSGPVEFDSGNLEPGASFMFVFTVEGTYPYLDDRERDDVDFHGTIIVAAGGSGGSAGPAATPGAGTTPAPASTSATVHMAGRSFSPSTATIAAGGSVTFINDDDREHTATAGSGAFDTGVLDPGARSTKAFPAAGSYAFLCAIHPEMTGRVEVTGAVGGGGGGGVAPVATPTPRPTARPSAQPPAPRATTSAASIVDFAFDPGTLEVEVGGAIVWTNRGAAPHTVTAADGSFDSEVIAAGATFERRFDTAGTIALVCTFHPEMRGTILVAAAGSPGSAAAGGSPAPVGSAQPPRATPTASAEPSASPSGGGAFTTAQSDGGPTTATGEGVARLALTVVLVVAAVGVFGWLIRGTMRPAASRSAGR
jgi:plastocyanin